VQTVGKTGTFCWRLKGSLPGCT